MYYWLGKMSGRDYPAWAGYLLFFLTFVGVHMMFFPQHFLGMQGMPRRYVDYPDAYAGFNAISSYGAYITFAATIFFVLLTIYTMKFGRRVSDNPWGESATTLEWTVSSPPPFHCFNELPKIK
jgi:cytochrome c oxidase subunit 1